MKSRPMLFSGPMVRALLEGRKTQTRRIVKPQPEAHLDPHSVVEAFDAGFVDVKPPHTVGSEIWVRETWAPTLRGVEPDGWQDLIEVPADGTKIEVPKEHAEWFDRVSAHGYHNRPSIHMARWASRITLKVTDVRVQRLQDISEEDAIAEGIIRARDEDGLSYSFGNGRTTNARRAYHVLWNSINGERAWDANPWVWAYTFEVKR